VSSIFGGDTFSILFDYFNKNFFFLLFSANSINLLEHMAKFSISLKHGVESKAQGRELYGNKGPCEVGPAAEGFTWCKNMIKVYFLLPKIPNWFNWKLKQRRAF
jgi:hypothetical protein